MLTWVIATDLFLGLASPALYHSMTASHGWSQRQWATSLADILAHALLTPDDH